MSKKKTVKDDTLAQQALAKKAEKAQQTANSMQGTEAGAIWNEIKDKNIEMFALPNQVVSMHVHPLNIEPNRLYLTLNSTSVLPSLETAIGKKYTVELADKFVIVARAVVPPTVK